MTDLTPDHRAARTEPTRVSTTADIAHVWEFEPSEERLAPPDPYSRRPEVVAVTYLKVTRSLSQDGRQSVARPSVAWSGVARKKDGTWGNSVRKGHIWRADDMPDWVAELVKSVPVPVEVVTR